MAAPPANALSQFYATTPWPLTYFSFVPAPEEGSAKRIVAYYYANTYTPKLVQSVLEASGFKKSESPRDSEIIVGTKQPQEVFEKLKLCQRVNHFSKAFCIGTKSSFHRAALQLAAKMDTSFMFYLPTFILPDQIEEFKVAATSAPLWIQKPVGKSHSRGIKLLKSAPDDFPAGSRVVVQKYTPYPLLIDDKKFDVRIYAAVISVDPLTIYVYNDGLMRIAELPFDENSMNMGVHLTTGDNCKVENLDRFWPLLESSKLEPAVIKQKMEDTIAGLIGIMREQFAQQKNAKCCFELYGFDFIVTLDGNLYCLEANVSPSMSFKTDQEEALKKQLMVDLFNLSSLPKDTPELEKLTSISAEADNKDLSDFLTILYFDQYQQRCGNFRCIFPTQQRNAQNTKYLETPTPSDLALSLWCSLAEEKKGDRVKIGVKAWTKFFP